MPVRVAYLIRSLETGGAERQLVELVRRLDRTDFEACILTYYGGGALEEQIREAGIPLISLEKSGRWDVISFVRRLRQELRRFEPNILHAYLTTANLLSLLAEWSRPRAKLVWSLRASYVDHSRYGLRQGAPSAIAERLEAALSGHPAVIVANSQAGRDLLMGRGVAASKITVIPNGIDTKRYRPNPAARARLRAEWGVGPKEILVGQVARIDPMKGHAVFLEAAAMALRQHADLRFLCLGGGQEALCRQLRGKAAELGIEDRVIWAGERKDVADCLNAIDIATSASLFGEGFSNAVGEAMASEVPCVVTDVGDSARIVAGLCPVVAPGDPRALAEGWGSLIALDAGARQALGRRCRTRIVDSYSVDLMAERTSNLYRDLIGTGAAAMSMGAQG